MRLFISFIITIIIIMTSLITGYTYYKNIELNQIIKENNKDIKKLDYENQLLKYKINQKNKLIIRYQNENKKIFRENRNNNYKNHTINIKPKKHYNYNINKTKNNNYNYNKKITKIKPEKHYYKKTHIKYKKYPRYSKYEKLISDSKIKQRPDNRFISNSMIYGIYKNRITHEIDCGKTKKIYKIVNECRAYVPYSTEIIYFKKTNLNELMHFNPKDHRIECKYDQKYGLMHDCRAKIFRYLY